MKILDIYEHVFGLSRLNCSPTISMITPRIVYNAAVRNTGAMMVVVILLKEGKEE
jgi:hypothetical protein